MPQAISKLAFDFERRKLAIEEVRELIYREILEYHPQVLQDYLSGGRLPTFLYPSAVDNFKRQFIHLEGGGEAGLLMLSTVENAFYSVVLAVRSQMRS